jgi:hypothetical protein
MSIARELRQLRLRDVVAKSHSKRSAKCEEIFLGDAEMIKRRGFCNGNSADDSNFPNPNGQISDNLQTYVGLDFGDATNFEPQTAISPFAFDIMTYCNQPQWFSAYTYEGVSNRLRAENSFASLFRAPGGVAQRSTKQLRRARARWPPAARRNRCAAPYPRCPHSACVANSDTHCRFPAR